jgi:hypothetical protein
VALSQAFRKTPIFRTTVTLGLLVAVVWATIGLAHATDTTITLQPGDTVRIIAPPPALPAPSTGMQAARIADLMNVLSVVAFPITDQNNDPWGSWPADYSAATTVAALDYLTAGSGLPINLRVYHYAGRETVTAPWLRQVHAATGARVSVAVGGGGGMADVPSMLALAADPATGIAWAEGINEPNNIGPVPAATTIAVQQAIKAGLPGGVVNVGPSIVFGLPFPAGYISPPYFSTTDLATINGLIGHANGHFYPPTLPDLNDGSGMGAFDDVVSGLGIAYQRKPIDLTEWHPTLFNANGQTANDKLAAYYGLQFLVRAWQLGVEQASWFALFDFGTIYRCGLFPTNATNPRAAAIALRALYVLTGDHGVTKSTFAPGRLPVAISGQQPAIAGSPRTGGNLAVFEASDGRYFILFWDAAVVPGGAASPWTFSFAGTPPVSVKEYNLQGVATDTTPIQTVIAPATARVISQMPAAFHLMVVQP